MAGKTWFSAIVLVYLTIIITFMCTCAVPGSMLCMSHGFLSECSSMRDRQRCPPHLAGSGPERASGGVGVGAFTFQPWEVSGLAHVEPPRAWEVRDLLQQYMLIHVCYNNTC